MDIGIGLAQLHLRFEKREAFNLSALKLYESLILRIRLTQSVMAFEALTNSELHRLVSMTLCLIDFMIEDNLSSGSLLISEN